MSTEYSLSVTEDVISHFNKILNTPFKKNKSEILSAVECTLKDLKTQEVEEYVEKHIQPLEDLLDLIADDKWKMSERENSYAMSALQYFCEENDIIPDSIPVVGYLDDCIVIDIVVDKLKQQIKEHKQFVKASKVYGKNCDYSIDDWHQTQRKESFSRIRHRRLKGLKGKNSRGTSFSF